DLQALPAGDREVVARALAKSPQARYPSCSDFVQALLAGLTEVLSSTISAAQGDKPPAPVLPDPRHNASKQATHRTPPAPTIATRTIPLRPPAPPGGEGFSGLSVDDLVSRTPLTEVWTARTQTGQPRLVKVLFAGTGPAPETAARLAALRHPFL